MPAHPMSLGPHSFGSKEEAKTYLRNMLNRYDLGDKVSSDDAVILMAAVQRHPRSAEKIGCGVASFSVRTADYGTRCFWVNRTDGSTDKFSIDALIHCT